MGRSRWIVALCVALVLPSAVLTVTGARSFHLGWKQLDNSFRERASATLEAVERSFAAVKEDVAAGREPAEPVSFDAQGRSGTSEPAQEASTDHIALLLSLTDEIDRWVSAGNTERALERLADLQSGADAALAAWALTSAAALHVDRDEERRRELLEELVERFPDVRDARGLKRAHAARFQLARSAEDTSPVRTAEMVELYGELCEDHVRPDQHAVASLKERVAEALESGERTREFALLRERDQTFLREARQRAGLLALPALERWIASGAPGGARVFSLPPDPYEGQGASDSSWLVSLSRPGDADGWSGGCAPLARVRRAALESEEVRAADVLGFEARIAFAGESAGDDDEPLASALLPAPLDGLEVAIVARDLDELRKRERRNLWIWAVLIVTALVIALFAGWATWRAVARELAAARGREAFVAAVTHELKTPLGSIRLLAEVLERGDVEPDKVQEFGQRTVKEADRLARLVDSVLEWSRIEQVGQSVPLVRTDLNDVAARAAESFEPQAREAGIQLIVRSSERPVTVLGDSPALEGAVLNLLDNACKYCERPEDIELWVSMRAGGRARIDVLDRGRGVPSADAEGIFEPFRRVGDELTRDRPGVGLGLALVHRISAAHGGRAIYAPREGGGSCFSIELPLGLDDEAPVDARDAPSISGAPGAPDTPEAGRG